MNLSKSEGILLLGVCVILFISIFSVSVFMKNSPIPQEPRVSSYEEPLNVAVQKEFTISEGMRYDITFENHFGTPVYTITDKKTKKQYLAIHNFGMIPLEKKVKVGNDDTE